MNDLLKEAIADAKAVREIALANAKLALEEAMTPRLQSMLSQKLAEEAEGEEEEKSVEEDYGDDWFEEEPGSVSEADDEEPAVGPGQRCAARRAGRAAAAAAGGTLAGDARRPRSGAPHAAGHRAP